MVTDRKITPKDLEIAFSDSFTKYAWYKYNESETFITEEYALGINTTVSNSGAISPPVYLENNNYTLNFNVNSSNISVTQPLLFLIIRDGNIIATYPITQNGFLIPLSL